MVRLLVVEDDTDVRECMTELLENEGFTVYSTGRGEEALDLMRHHEWDIILLDLSLPGLTGEAILETLRAEGLLDKVPVIAMSASPKRVAALARDGLAVGLNKPFELEELDRVVGRCLKIKQVRPPYGFHEPEEQSDLRHETR